MNRRRSVLEAAIRTAIATTLVATAPAPAAVAGNRAAKRASKHLSGDSTLAEWREADSPDRSRVAVALARQHLKPDATKLEVATAAMEITGCLSRTATDLRFSAWKVAPTAATCLTAPEKPKP